MGFAEEEWNGIAAVDRAKIMPFLVARTRQRVRRVGGFRGAEHPFPSVYDLADACTHRGSQCRVTI